MDLIRTSRTESTTLLATTLAGLDQKPEVFMVASAIGYYGNRGDEELTEASTSGDGYLPETCIAWEASAQPAKDAGIRTIHARTGGIVLDATGGGLGKMLLPANTCFGCGCSFTNDGVTTKRCSSSNSGCWLGSEI